MAVISQELAILITGKAQDFITQAAKAAQSAEQLAVSEAKVEAQEAKTAAATDRLAVSQAKLDLAQARSAGDTNSIASAQTTLAAAQDKASISRAQAAVAANSLSVAELTAKASTSGLTEEAAASGGSLDSLLGSVTGLAGGLDVLAPIAAATAASLVFKSVLDGIANFEKLGDTLHQTQLITGGTAEQVSLLVGQMQQLGVDPDTAARALQRLGSSIGDGSTKLGQFGVQVARNKDGTVDLIGTLNNLRGAYVNSADAATKDAIAKQLGLRSAQDLLPLLNLTNAQIQELNANTANSGAIFSQSDIENARELTVASNQLHQGLQGLEILAGETLAPALIAVEKVLTDIVHVVDEVGSVGKGAFSFLTDLIPVIGPLNTLKGALGSTKDATDSLASSNSGLSSSDTAASDGTDKLTSALEGQADAINAAKDAANSLADANFRVQDAQNALNKLLAQGPVDENAVAAAKQTLSNASDSVTRALNTEAQAQQALNTARQGASALDLADANSKINLAGDAINSAKAAAEQAKEKYDQLLGSGTASQGDLAAAAADLKTKQDDVTQSIIDQQKAQGDLNTLRKKGTDQDPAVQSAERSLQDAHLSVTQALQAQTDARAKLAAAEAPDPDYSLKVAEARQNLANAHQAVANAQEAEVKANLALGPAQAKVNDALKVYSSNLSTVRADLEALNGEGIVTNSLASLLPGAAGTASNSLPGGGLAGLANQVAGGAGKFFNSSNSLAGAANQVAGGAGTYFNTPPVPAAKSPAGARVATTSSSSAGPIVEQNFYGYSNDVIGPVAAREASLSIHSVVPALIQP